MDFDEWNKKFPKNRKNQQIKAKEILDRS